MTPRYAIETPASPGAVGLVRVVSHDPSAVTNILDCAPVDTGDARVRRVLGLDHALVARPDDRTWLVMPHGGPALMRAIAARLHDAGWCTIQHESESESMEERLAHALAAAASPLAIGVLLDQPARWANSDPGTHTADRRLDRLIVPPRVVAVGAPNIGKSSLLNGVAGRSLAVAFDRPGTTRDAVGALIDCAGLVVRWTDTPGIECERTRDEVLAQLVGADLVLRCRDAGCAPADLDLGSVPVVDVVTRSDRADDTGPGVRTSAERSEGLGELVKAIRATLVPDDVLADPRPWRFWETS